MIKLFCDSHQSLNKSLISVNIYYIDIGKKRQKNFNILKNFTIKEIKPHTLIDVFLIFRKNQKVSAKYINVCFFQWFEFWKSISQKFGKEPFNLFCDNKSIIKISIASVRKVSKLSLCWCFFPRVAIGTFEIWK